jgi:hypothetical protein
MTHFFGFVGNLILSSYGRVIEREVLSDMVFKALKRFKAMGALRPL